MKIKKLINLNRFAIIFIFFGQHVNADEFRELNFKFFDAARDGNIEQVRQLAEGYINAAKVANVQ